ncbi:hypothetical protein [Myroides odoratus]
MEWLLPLLEGIRPEFSLAIVPVTSAVLTTAILYHPPYPPFTS